MDKDKPRKFSKKKFAQAPPAAVVQPRVAAVGLAAPVRPLTAATSVASVRRALNIPHHNAIAIRYEAHLDKQIHQFKQTKSMEMFKERGAKFTCVDSFHKDKETVASGESSSSTAACPMDLLSPTELEAIRTYEEKGRIGIGASTSTETAFGAFNPSSVDVHIPRFFPPPPQLSRQPPFNNGQQPSANPAAQANQQLMEEGLLSSPPYQQQQAPQLEPATSSAEPQQEKEIKQEVDAEELDEIPSFNNAIATCAAMSASPAAAIAQCAKSGSTTEFAENEEQKKKLQLLWSICQEELTVDSELEKKTKEAQELRIQLETVCKSLQAAEKQEQNLKKKKERIAERKRRLLTGTDAGGSKIKREQNM